MAIAKNNKLLYCFIIGTCMLAYSAGGDGYQLMDDFEFSLNGTDYLLFEVKVCATASLLLMSNKSDFQSQLYEIELGGSNASECTVRKDKSGTIVANAVYTSLSCDTPLTFWVTWDETTLLVGTGTDIGRDEVIQYHDLKKLVEINHVSVSPGYWIFYRSNCGCCSHEPRYCQSLQESGITESGIYNVPAVVSDGMKKIYCDMKTDDGGGWLVFQRRKDGSEDFYRVWSDYENGFGDMSGEFWLGNRHLSSIMSQGHYELRIDMEDWEGNRRYAKYNTFIIGNSCDNYKLTVYGYSGDAGDSMGTHNGMPFSTNDRDNDDHGKKSCAEIYRGGWWYARCHLANLNGLYLNGNQSADSINVVWYTWTDYKYSLKFTEMKMREICKH